MIEYHPQALSQAMVWISVLVWPFFGFGLTQDIFSDMSNYSIWAKIGIIVVWLLWVFGLKRMITEFKNVFKK